MDLTPQLVVKVQDQVHVSFADGPLPSGPDLPPLLILVPVLVEDGIEICRVVEDHSQEGLGQAQEQARYSNPAQERNRLLHDRVNPTAESRILFDFFKFPQIDQSISGAIFQMQELPEIRAKLQFSNPWSL